MIYRVFKALFMLALICGLMSCTFIPNIPEQLTLIDHQQQQYTSTCPDLENSLQSKSSHEHAIKTSLPTVFTLLNWNIYKQQNIQWSAALDKWLKQVDLITLQEVKLSAKFKKLAQRYKLHYTQNIAFTYQGDIYGVNTLSKIKPSQVCGTRFAEPWSIIPKTGIASTYQIESTDKKLLLINLHAVNFTFTATPLKEQITPYVKLIQQHKGPVIISGDFNTWTDARMEVIIMTFDDLGFTETAFSQEHRLTMFGLPLDHVFYRDLHVLSSKSIPTEASDHSPQLIQFSLLPNSHESHINN